MTANSSFSLVHLIAVNSTTSANARRSRKVKQGSHLDWCRTLPTCSQGTATLQWYSRTMLSTHMTVADNMGFALKIAGTPKDEIRARVEKAAAILDLTRYLDRKPKALSGGQRQRVLWVVQLFVSLRSSSWMSLCSTWMQSCVSAGTRTQIAALQRQLDVTHFFT